ncbi:F-box domain-containing protein [Mycena sanguinolenta]|uniref:F-box domain-containing protein n=1 Tax=Mycena sanguinolenta TaxID=230812 RepID=A0A8H7CQ52_9AGAR|nr:F-box domain-containing protein [Mycena sanguinolenta]
MLDALQPVHKLPFETTSEIFIQCLPTSYTVREWNTANPRAPMLLLHVCRIWREIAIGTPALWAKMELSMDNAHSHDIAQRWLKWAKASPLAVKLHQWPSEESQEEDTWSIAIFETLLGRSRNFEFLEVLDIPLDYVRELDQLTDSSNFPSLQKLTIGVEEDGLDRESMHEKPCIQLFANAPLLREVEFIGDTSPKFFGALPWPQLTKYTGTYVHIDDFLNALRISSNLIECTLATGRFDRYFMEILLHPSLRSLTLCRDNCFHHPRSPGIFGFLTLPALETLRILRCPDDLFNDQRFPTFLTRSSPPLRQFTVHLDHNILDDDDTQLNVDAFLSMPSLIELEIWNPQEMSIFFAHFTAVAFLPQLQHFSAFHPCHSSLDVAHTQLRTVQAGVSARWNSRNHAVAQLKSFSVVWDRDIGDLPEDILVAFRTMASEGLNIRLKSPTQSYI